jgi:hypothetical protein
MFIFDLAYAYILTNRGTKFKRGGYQFSDHANVIKALTDYAGIDF